jgi:DNA-binding MarR family transcriptional regulator
MPQDRKMLDIKGTKLTTLKDHADKVGLPSSNNAKSPKINNKSLLDDIDLKLFILLDSVHFLIARMREQELAKDGLTLEQAHLLHLLSTTETTTMKQISFYNKRQHHSVSTQVNRMVEAGLVYKTKDRNHRSFQIRMTKIAKNKYENVTINSLKKAFSPLKLEEKEKLAFV